MELVLDEVGAALDLVSRTAGITAGGGRAHSRNVGRVVFCISALQLRTACPAPPHYAADCEQFGAVITSACSSRLPRTTSRDLTGSRSSDVRCSAKARNKQRPT
jgi:hypothetical protein